MLETLALVCQCWGAAALAALLCWLAAVACTKLRAPRLLDRLSSRAVLITGCDSGFGHALARRLDGLGVPVLAGCLFPEGDGARSLAEDCSSRLRVLPLDVTSDQQVADAVAAVQAALKDNPGTELWAVVNNAGIGDVAEVDYLPLEKFKRVLEVDTVGPVRVTKAFLPLLKKSKGRLVNVASPAGRIPFEQLSAYCAAKSALIMFSDVLRLEMKKWSVTVCSIEPSLYGTAIADVENVKATVSDNIRKTLEAERACIGEEARNQLEILLQFTKSVKKGDISEVVDEMMIACVGQHPQRRHIPGFTETVLYTIAGFVPDWLRDVLYHSGKKLILLIWR